MGTKKLTLFQYLIIGVAVSAVISQLLINTYYELNAPEAGQKALLEDKIAKFYVSKVYLDRRHSDSLAIALLARDASIRLQRNENSVENGGQIVTNTNNQNALIKEINEKTQAWVDKELAGIRSKYSVGNTGNRWGGLGLIFVFEFLSVMLGFMAARILMNDAIQPKRLGVFIAIGAFALSIYAQTTSCQITEKGLFLLLNDSSMARGYSNAFIVIVPLYFAIGSFDLETKPKNIAVSEIKVEEKPSIDGPKLKAEVFEHTEEESLTHRKTIRSSKAELTVPIDLNSAVMLYRTGKISQKNGWSQRRIAREFAGGDLNKVHKLISDGLSSPIGGLMSKTVKQHENT